MRASLCGSSSPDGALFGVPSRTERKSKKKKTKERKHVLSVKFKR